MGYGHSGELAGELAEARHVGLFTKAKSVISEQNFILEVNNGLKRKVFPLPVINQAIPHKINSHNIPNRALLPDPDLLRLNRVDLTSGHTVPKEDPRITLRDDAGTRGSYPTGAQEARSASRGQASFEREREEGWEQGLRGINASKDFSIKVLIKIGLATGRQQGTKPDLKKICIPFIYEPRNCLRTKLEIPRHDLSAPLPEQKFQYNGIMPELEEKLDIMFGGIVATGADVWVPNSGVLPHVHKDVEELASFEEEHQDDEANTLHTDILDDPIIGGEACTKPPFHQPGEVENLDSFRFLLKQAENLDSFHFLLKQAKNLDLLADNPSTETPRTRDDDRRR
ncbi:hypothetical protein IEQ34_016752 [Dendrobium chrysotoxum]|uniref:Uncharacterized protein n=1 Tax=Dendrobium chrysotoxum TaxID=161865 RepID=A0AAV7GGH0_DENCH|nr:hypothetical protein IEQ34_016752 [Dendrobium chrysotoxum]